MKKQLTLCLIYKNDKILLGFKKRGFGAGRWNGFGGKVELGETIEEAAKREVFEESGLEIREIEKVGIIDFSFIDKNETFQAYQDLQIHIFSANDFFGEVVESEEMLPKWFDINKIPFAEMWPDDIYWFSMMFAGEKFKGEFILDRPSTAAYSSRVIKKKLEKVEYLD